MARRIGLTLVLKTTIGLAACNTVNGAGKDVKSAGTAISDASGQGKKNKVHIGMSPVDAADETHYYVLVESAVTINRLDARRDG